MGVGGEVGNYLIGCDAHGDGFADGFARDFAGDHVWVADLKTGKELEDGYLEVRGCVGVDAVVCFDNDEADGVARGGGGEGRAEAAGIGGEGCGEAGGVKDGGV